MKPIPIALIYSRLFIGIVIIFISSFQDKYYKIVAIVLLSIGLLSDIFDGIIARKFSVATEKLRRQDSAIDQRYKK